MRLRVKCMLAADSLQRRVTSVWLYVSEVHGGLYSVGSRKIQGVSQGG